MSTEEAGSVREFPVRRRDTPWVSAVPVEQLGVPGGPLTSLSEGQRLIPFRFPNKVVGYVTVTAEDCRAVLSDPRFHAKWLQGGPQFTEATVDVPEMPGFIPGMNGPEHLRVRRLAAGDFSVKRVEQLRPRITEVVDKYLDAMDEQGSPVDLYKQYCLAVPSEVISGMLGIPETLLEAFQSAARLTIGGAVSSDDIEAPARAVARLHEVISEVVALKKAHPGDDLITRLTQVDDPALSVQEICGLCTNLLLAGHDTTAGFSSYEILYILTHPEQAEIFHGSPDRRAAHIEEMVRYATLGMTVPRLVTEDVNYHGQQLRKGEWLMPAPGIANADPSVCPYATTLDLDRDRVPHIAFGFGPHTCLGQHLARAEMQIMLTRLFDRFPTLELAVPFEEMPWGSPQGSFRIVNLPVRW
jgi:cytochrome P450